MKSSRLRESEAPSAGARRQLPAGLAALALAWHLLAPGLCLAQMLSTGSLGAICAVAKAGTSTTSLPDVQDATAQALDTCGHCLAACAIITDRESYRPSPAPRAVEPSWQSVPAHLASRSAWRPPPRGPPAAA